MSPQTILVLFASQKNCKWIQNASIISIMLTIPNEPGSLSKLLEKFYIYNLNLDRIESRPIQDGSFGVVFHIDFKGNLNDRKVAAFLNSLLQILHEL